MSCIRLKCFRKRFSLKVFSFLDRKILMQNKNIDYPISPNETERLAALYRYNILDTLPEVEFDNVAYLAQQICQTPVALISLVDKDRQWFKAKIGLELSETPRNIAFCSHTILEPESLQICDAMLDSRFAKNPLVTQDPHIRFYAGVPLITPTQDKIGTLCVMDFVPRQLTAEQLKALNKLTKQVIAQLELKQYISALQISESRTKAIIDNMLLGLIVTNELGIIESVNPAAENIFEYQEKELIGKELSLLLPELTDATRLNFLQASQNQYPPRIQWQGISKNANKLFLELSVYEFSTKHGVRFANNIKEISDQQELEKLKTSFISTINHELRTPLTSINGALNLLSCGILGQLPEEAQEIVELAERNSVRLISLLNDILDLQRLEASRSEMNFEVSYLSELVTLASKEVLNLAKEKNISLVLNATEVKVFADHKHLLQALISLFKNAIKFSPEHSTVKIVIEEHQAWATVKIIDQGCGIAPNHLSAIFDRFKQVDFTDDRQQGGAGLGLAICKAIIEQHNGVIGVESIINQGSTFWFRIPAICSLENQLNSVKNKVFSILAKSISQTHKIKSENTFIKSPEILLVDDDKELLEILSIDLSQQGLSVTTSTNGQEAVRIAQENLPNLIVLDINIPNGNGFEVVEQLRSEPKLRNISLIIYSGRDLTGEQKNKLSLGPTRFLTKTRVSCADFRNNVLELLNSSDSETKFL